MIIVIRVLLGLGTVFLCIYGINQLIDRNDIKEQWRMHKESAEFTLPLEKFKSLYYVSSEKYRLFKHETRYMKSDYKWVNIGFSYPDYKKYLKWIERLEADKEYMRELKSKEDFLKSVQSDITHYRENAKQEFEAKQEEIQRMVNEARMPITSIINSHWSAEP